MTKGYEFQGSWIPKNSGELRETEFLRIQLRFKFVGEREERCWDGMRRDWPEGPQQISPGQGYASYTSVAAALGLRLSVCVALKGRNK
jgi:hypothetical protein